MKRVLLVLGVVTALTAIAFGACNSSTTKSANHEGLILSTPR